MTHDTRLALIDKDGDERFPATIDGTFQIGKAVEDTPTDIGKLAHAVLIEDKEARFVSADGRKRGTFKFRGRDAVAYRLDPVIAARLGIPAQATR
jgi:hypothetical protein